MCFHSFLWNCQIRAVPSLEPVANLQMRIQSLCQINDQASKWSPSEDHHNHHHQHLFWILYVGTVYYIFCCKKTLDGCTEWTVDQLIPWLIDRCIDWYTDSVIDGVRNWLMHGLKYLSIVGLIDCFMASRIDGYVCRFTDLSVVEVHD